MAPRYWLEQMPGAVAMRGASARPSYAYRNRMGINLRIDCGANRALRLSSSPAGEGLASQALLLG
jgi:hypothetical protein